MGRPTDSPKISRVTARIDIDTKKYLINTVKNTISIKQKQSAAQFWNCWKTYNRAWRSSTQSKRICRFPPVRSPRRRKHIKTCFPFSSTYLLKKWKEAAHIPSKTQPLPVPPMPKAFCSINIIPYAANPFKHCGDWKEIIIMQSILEALYYGNLCPSEKPPIPGSDTA